MPEPVLEPADILAIHQLLALYAHLLDDKQYERLSEIFTEDAVLTFPGRDREPVRTAAAISEFFASAAGSSAHHTSNIVIIGAGTEVRARSKFFVPYTRPDHDAHRWYGGVYDDIVVRTADGWRIASRSIDGRWQLTVDERIYPAHRATF
jgi:3-phenylpropionate/cinnamic acid dioxygenase small subunit